MLYGRPGFVTVPTPDRSHRRPALPGDPLADALNSPVGGLAIEPSTRRRMRLNGEAFTSDDGVTIALEQVFSNCPKYIATRDVGRGRAGARVGAGADGALDARARALLAAADTAFVATRGLDGCDVSHRGGRPGFLQTPDAHTIVWPDYSGNNMFKTLGNIAADGAAGLTVVDPATARRCTSAATPSSTRPARSRSPSTP